MKIEPEKRPKKKAADRKKSVVFLLVLILAVFAEVICIRLSYLEGVLKLEKDMFYWLFSATAQSMAAVFAVVGMFVVFRYQNQVEKVRNICKGIKAKLRIPHISQFLPEIYPEAWIDEKLANSVEDLLKKSEESGPLPEPFEIHLKDAISFLRENEKTRDSVISRAILPLSFVLFTFMGSIILMPFTDSIAGNCSGLVVLIIIIAMITISMFNIFYYLLNSIRDLERK